MCSYRATPRRSDLSPSQDLECLSPVDPTAFAAGAIIRIKMKNFVTYSSAEFHCGPSMNMVLGPNGTGKSSLVCAICLGLGWAPIHLGRSKSVSDFVKHGHREAEIEIELQAGVRQRGRNPIVKRIIKREDNSSKWFLNRQPSTHKEIQILMHNLGIQVDNLCQFLPQDKVADFAALSPVDLLEQTQKAVGTEDMAGWHEELKMLGNDKRKLASEKEHTAKTLAELEQRQNTQKAEVDRLRERSTIQFRLAALEKHRPAVKYQEEKEKYDMAIEQKRNAKAALVQLRAQVEPALRDLNAKDQYCKKAEDSLQKKRQLVARLKQIADTKLVDIEKHKQSISQLDDEVKRHGQQKANRKADIRKRQQLISQLESRRKNPPPEFDAAEMNAKKREKESEKRSIQSGIERLTSEAQEHIGRFRQLKTRKQELEDEIKNLKTKSGRQVGKLKTLSVDSYKAWDIIQQNKDKFELEVFGPPIITCSLKKPELAAAIENAIQRNDQMAFTVQSERDNRMLQDLLYRQQGLADISIRTMQRKPSDYKPPIDEQTLRRHKFDGWLIDAMDGPDTVMAMLSENCRLHRVAFSLKDNDANLESLPHNLTEFVVKDKYFQITRRPEYGPEAVSTSVRKVHARGVWTENAADGQQEQCLVEECEAIERTILEIREKIMPHKDQAAKLEEQKAVLESEVKDIELQKISLQRARADWEMLPTKIQEEQSRLEKSLQLQKESDEGLHEKRREIEQLALQRADHAINFSNALNTVRKMMHEQLELELIVTEGNSDFRTLQEKNKEVNSQLQARKKEVEECTKLSEQLKQAAIKLKNQAVDIKNSCNEEEKAIQDEFDRRCREEDKICGALRMAELDADINSCRQRLQLVAIGNPHIIEDFEKRVSDIERIRARVGTLQDDLANYSASIDSVRSKWEPELDEMIANVNDAFSYNFSKIKCAGEVEVFKDEEDFAQWAIHIRVKFREHENLSLLNSQRQSGGERSVTTIFYLLALQSQAKSPFRVVDEINQGMDPRNERMVHERMVDIACAQNTSQYFLITPKLLAGLKYHERMKVHVIYSGDSMPENNTKALQWDKLAADLVVRRAGKVSG